MDDLVIQQEKKGRIEIFQDIPHDLQKHSLKHALPNSLRGDHFKALWQAFPALGFVAWLNSYWTTAPVVLTATGSGPVLELRIALKNIIRGTWDKLSVSELQARHFQMGFVPGIATRAVFEAPAHYVTFDVHFELWWLEKLGFDFNSLERFISRASKKHLAELSLRPHHITHRMLDNIHAVIDMRYADFGAEQTLEELVKEILFEALEVVLLAERDLPELTAEQEDKLDEVKMMIERDCPDYAGNEKLMRTVGLNEFFFYTEFKRKFKCTPREHYQQVRMMMAKQLLREGLSITEVALEVGFLSASPFIEKFKEMFGCTPREFSLSRHVQCN